MPILVHLVAALASFLVRRLRMRVRGMLLRPLLRVLLPAQHGEHDKRQHEQAEAHDRGSHAPVGEAVVGSVVVAKVPHTHEQLRRRQHVRNESDEDVDDPEVDAHAALLAALAHLHDHLRDGQGHHGDAQALVRLRTVSAEIRQRQRSHRNGQHDHAEHDRGVRDERDRCVLRPHGPHAQEASKALHENTKRRKVRPGQDVQRPVRLHLLRCLCTEHPDAGGAQVDAHRRLPRGVAALEHRVGGVRCQVEDEHRRSRAVVGVAQHSLSTHGVHLQRAELRQRRRRLRERAPRLRRRHRVPRRNASAHDERPTGAHAPLRVWEAHGEPARARVRQCHRPAPGRIRVRPVQRRPRRQKGGAVVALASTAEEKRTRGALRRRRDGWWDACCLRRQRGDGHGRGRRGRVRSAGRRGGAGGRGRRRLLGRGADDVLPVRDEDDVGAGCVPLEDVGGPQCVHHVGAGEAAAARAAERHVVGVGHDRLAAGARHLRVAEPVVVGDGAGRNHGGVLRRQVESHDGRCAEHRVRVHHAVADSDGAVARRGRAFDRDVHALLVRRKLPVHSRRHDLLLARVACHRRSDAGCVGIERCQAQQRQRNRCASQASVVAHFLLLLLLLFVSTFLFYLRASSLIVARCEYYQ
eukprot:Rhum_TRINITY_DN1579_c0_g1::Rhum_TRINITY_DN1579_c0_g1_i1::g.4453::m.4453